MTDDQIKEFFMWHKGIENLEIDSRNLSITYSDEEKAKKLTEIVDFALENLKLLKSINVLEEPKV